MAQYSMNAYDADVYIPEFKGLMQYGDQMNGDLRFSPDCMNVETPAGVLQPAGYFKGTLSGFVEPFPTGYTATLMRFYDGTAMQYVLAANGKLLIGDFSEGTIWTAVPYPQDVESYQSNKWSWEVYETIIDGNPVNTLLFSNAKDGMFAMTITNHTPVVTKVTGAPKKFSHIERFAERIWGCGADDEPDTMYYSAVYSYSDWEQNNTEPADGGGAIREPTWDLDNINSLVRFGDGLIAFTGNRAWKISGSDPTNFVIQEQFGNGTTWPESVSVYNERIFMFRHKVGIVSYDGAVVTPFVQTAAYDFLKNINGYTNVYGTVMNDKYYLALTYLMGTGIHQHQESKLLVYNFLDGSLLISDSPHVVCFCKDYGYAVTRDPGTSGLGIYQLTLDSWTDKNNPGYATKWMTPWVTLGRKDIQKGGFDLYFYPELAEDAVTGVTFTFSIQTEKKTKTKSYTVQPLTARQKEAGKKYKQKRLHFGGAGRRFRLTIQTAAGVTTPWRLIGGIHIIAEIDKD